MKQSRRINLDQAAGRANPSGLHREGVVAARALTAAREMVAAPLAARPDEIVFTSGGTESNNLAIFGLKPRHLITTESEHASIIEPAKKFRTTFLSDISELKKSLTEKTDLVSIIYAHNEVGTIQPIKEIAKIIRQFRSANKSKTPYLHIDACQAPRFLDLDVQKLGVDLLTLNGHKLGVPGVGCLFVRRGVPLQPLVLGGGQERGLRSGTENVAGIVKFARALKAAQKDRGRVSRKLTKWRDYFIEELLKIPGAELSGSRESRLPNNVSISFAGLSSEQIVLELDARGVACATGAACGRDTRAIMKPVRFSFGPEIKKTDLDYVLRILPPILKKLDSVRPLNQIL